MAKGSHCTGKAVYASGKSVEQVHRVVRSTGMDNYELDTESNISIVSESFPFIERVGKGSIKCFPCLSIITTNKKPR